MIEPYLSEFKELVRAGAGTLDIHDATKETAYTKPIRAFDALVEREVQRVELHQQHLCPLLEQFVGRTERILDVGCGTGATTVALALSDRLQAAEVIGIDPNRSSLEAAEVRAKAHGVPEARISFQPAVPDKPLCYVDARFDLVVCVSVLEYVRSTADRYRLVNELKRVTRPGGHIFLVTPNPYRLTELHTGKVLQNVFRREGYPWASTPRELRKMFSGCEAVALDAWLAERGLERLGMPGWYFLRKIASFSGWIRGWQRLLVRKLPLTLGA